MSKDEAVMLAFAALGVDAPPADVKKWVRDAHKLDVGNDLVTRLRQSVRAKAQEMAGAPAPKEAAAAGQPLDVSAVSDALAAARRLVAACGGKDAAKRLVDVC